jgi:P-type Cu+ transporter
MNRGTARERSAGKMEKDPVCGMEVDPKTARQTAVYEGRTYYFCSPGCKKAFEAEPQKYLDPTYKPSM